MTEPLTDMEIPEAGRELDAMIAEKVMGMIGRRIVYRWQDRKSRQYPLIAFDYAKDWSGAENSFGSHVNESGEKENVVAFARRYSTEISDAWRVVEKLKVDGYEISVHNSWPYNDGRRWACDIVKPGSSFWNSAQSDTAPLAICRAALKSVASSLKSGDSQ